MSREGVCAPEPGDSVPCQPGEEFAIATVAAKRALDRSIEAPPLFPGMIQHILHDRSERAVGEHAIYQRGGAGLIVGFNERDDASARAQCPFRRR